MSLQRAMCTSACILIFNDPAKLTRGFKWYMEIEVINLMSYFFLNNVIL